MSDPRDEELGDYHLQDIGDEADASDLDKLDDDSLYLDEADRGALRQPQENACIARVRTRSLESTSIFDQIESRKLAIQKRIEAARVFAIRDARQHLKVVRVAASRELQATSLPLQCRSQALRYFMRRFVACAASQARQNSDALMTPNMTFRLCYKTILHCSFRGLADRGYCSYPKAVALADKLDVSLSLGKTSLSLEKKFSREEDQGGCDPEFGTELSDVETDTQFRSNGYSDEPAFPSETSEASAAHIRACSKSLRQAARQLLKVERKLNATRSLRP